VVVFVTLTRSLPPRTSAMSNKIKTAAPTIHTHGWAYQVCVSVCVVVVTVELPPPLSCPKTKVWIKLKIKIVTKALILASFDNSFIKAFFSD